MTDTKGYINKKDKGSGPYEDLYLEGVELLQQLSGAHWTDYNEHDPGVTILENLSYTLTDLSHKTSLPIRDILAESKGEPLVSGDNGFFIPSDILTSNPITIDDLRKIFIDKISNIKNVWIKPQISFLSPFNQFQDMNQLKGLYHIFLEVYNYPSDPKEIYDEEKRINDEVRALFNSNRNLCEDLYEVTIFKPFGFKIKLKLSLDEMASGEEVFANIFYQVNDYLAHEVQFDSLWELQEKNKDINTIFNGPLLENGFIRDEELRPKLTRIELSEIIKIISKQKSVVSVDFFELSCESHKDSGFEPVRQDYVQMPSDSAPVLLFPEDNRDLALEHRGVRFSPDLKEVRRQLSYIQAMNYGSFKSVSKSLNTIEIPEGQPLGIASYFPMKEQFPANYGIGQMGLQNGLDTKRYAQASQLQAYLLPFDQLMHNFLQQLSHLYQLYDTDPKQTQSYFVSALEDMPDLVHLIKTNTFESKEESLEQWDKVLQKLNLDFDKDALFRLNEIADNLLARYSEVFPAYSLKKIHLNSYGKNRTDRMFEEELLNSKRNLISNYGRLSYNRAKAFDYKALELPPGTDTFEASEHDIVPGIIQKASMLMGIKNYKVRSLYKEVMDSGIKIYQRKDGVNSISERLEMVYPKDSQEALAAEEVIVIDEKVKNMKDSFYFIGQSQRIFEDVLREGVLPDNYQIKQSDSDRHHSYYVLFRNGEKNSLIHVSDTRDEAKDAIKYAIDFLVDLNQKSEGLYLIEHLLLAPPYHGDNYGFSLKLKVKDQWIEFNQVRLMPNGKRNEIFNALLELRGLNVEVTGRGSKYYVQVLDKKGQELAETVQAYDDKQKAQEDCDYINSISETSCLDSIAKELVFYAYYNGKDKVDETFFSFQMSVILPSWPVRFQDQNFRTKFNNILYEHAPIHIAFQSYWLDVAEIKAFEDSYYQWLRFISNNDQAEEQMKYTYDLICKIQDYNQKHNY